MKAQSLGALARCLRLPAALLLAGLVSISIVAAPLDGAKLYLDCAACHGKDGGGVADGSVPAIGGQPAAVIIHQLGEFRGRSRQDLRMQHFSDEQHLESDEAVEAVALHVASLQRRNAATTGSGERLERGRADFAALCAGCHGAEAKAVAARGIPALAGQHAPYLERRLRDANVVNGMGRLHAGLATRLQRDGIAAIADWLSRLPPPAPTPTPTPAL